MYLFRYLPTYFYGIVQILCIFNIVLRANVGLCFHVKSSKIHQHHQNQVLKEKVLIVKSESLRFLLCCFLSWTCIAVWHPGLFTLIVKLKKNLLQSRFPNDHGCFGCFSPSQIFLACLNFSACAVPERFSVQKWKCIMGKMQQL